MSDAGLHCADALRTCIARLHCVVHMHHGDASRRCTYVRTDGTDVRTGPVEILKEPYVTRDARGPRSDRPATDHRPDPGPIGNAPGGPERVIHRVTR